MSMPSSIKTPRRVLRVERGVLDTSVVLDYEQLPVERLPALAAITAVTLAELEAGPHAATDIQERSRRQARLQLCSSQQRPYREVFHFTPETPRTSQVSTALCASFPCDDRRVAEVYPQWVSA